MSSALSSKTHIFKLSEDQVIKQKRCEESVVITYNHLFGLLGENVDPLAISLSSHGICKVLILFRSIQTYNLVKKGSFDAGLFLDILRRFHRKTVFCPGIPKSCIQSTGQRKLKTRLEYHEIPFPRYQTTECTVYHDKPVGATDILLQCNACSLFSRAVSSNIRLDASVFPPGKESTVSVTTTGAGKYADEKTIKSDYSCLKKLLRKNTKTCLIDADVVDQDLDGKVTFSLGLSSVGRFQMGNLNSKPSNTPESVDIEMLSSTLNGDHSQSSQVLKTDNLQCLPCNILPLNHLETGNEVSKTIRKIIEKRMHDTNEKDTVNDCFKIASAGSNTSSNVHISNVSDQSLKTEQDFITYHKASADDCHFDINMITSVLELSEHRRSGETNHIAVTEQDINNAVTQSNLNYPRSCHNLVLPISSQNIQQRVDYSGRTNKAFCISSTLQDSERTSNYDSYGLNIDGISLSRKNSFETSYTKDNRANITAPPVNKLKFRHMATCSETSSASERLDDIISQLKKSVLKPRVDNLQQLSEGKKQITTAVSQPANTKTSQELLIGSSSFMKTIEVDGKRKRTPSKKVLENRESLRKCKRKDLETSVAEEKASYKSYIVSADDVKIHGNVNKMGSPKQKRSQCQATTENLYVKSEGCETPSRKPFGEVAGEVARIKLRQKEKQQDMLHDPLHNRAEILIGRKSTQPERKSNPTAEPINSTETDAEGGKNICHAVGETKNEHEGDLEIYVESMMQLANQPPLIAADVEPKMKKNGDPAQCPVCFEFYSSDRTLKRHMRIHSLVRPYSCPVCNKSFVQKITMKVHMRLHSGEKPHQCFICGRSFAQKSNMETHVRRHLGVRPYKCDICSKGFSDKGSLGEHMKTHTGEQPYLCTICGKSFSQRANMRTHLSRHKAEKPYLCTQCDKSFKNKDSFMKHRRHHRSGAGH